MIWKAVTSFAEVPVLGSGSWIPLEPEEPEPRTKVESYALRFLGSCQKNREPEPRT